MNLDFFGNSDRAFVMLEIFVPYASNFYTTIVAPR